MAETNGGCDIDMCVLFVLLCMDCVPRWFWFQVQTQTVSELMTLLV